MTDERDPKVSAAYRALGAEEPPRALDDAILAASRRPAKSWTQRWALPLSLAAVVVLSVTVTLQMQLEQPGIDGLRAPRPAQEARMQEQPQALKLKTEEQLKLAAKPQARQNDRRAEPKAFADASADRAPRAATGPAGVQAPAAAPPPAAVAGNLASRGDTGSGADSRYGDSALRREEERVARDAEAAARAPQAAAALAKRSAPESAARPAPAPTVASAPSAAPAAAGKPAAEQAAKLSGETPEQELERIAKLRAEGRHEEADKALAEFRRRHPDYRIGEDLLRRVERR